MYNMAYIREYSEQEYIDTLKSPEKLEKLKKDYLNQYTDKSDASFLAFKESLDHYVRMMLERKPELINSTGFRNYLNYILSISKEKSFKTFDGYQLNPELNTNPVLRDDNLRKKIFDVYLPIEIKGKIEKSYMFTHEYTKLVLKTMEEGKKLNQMQVDLVADYIYSSRDVSNKKGEIFAKYILNNSKKYGIKSSAAIIGAMTTVITDNYSLDDEVKNSRFYIAEYDGEKRVQTAHSSGNKRYCVFQKSIIDQISLISANSMFMSRTNKEKDIYWILMVSNHELTHQHQKYDYVREKMTTSGLSCAIKQVLTDNMPREVYNGRVITDYTVNHDSDETEMEADEEGWRQTRQFIYSHVDRENRRILDSKGQEQDIWFIAKNNEEIIQIRRAFSGKKDVKTAIAEVNLPKEKKSGGMYYAHYDILNMSRIIKKDSSLIGKYKMLDKLFYQNGEMRCLDILKMDLYKNSQVDGISMNDRNNSGRELGTFVLNYKWNNVLREIENNKLTSEQEVKQIANNMYHIIHESVLKVRDFNRIIQENRKDSYRAVDPSQYNETNTKYKLNDNNSKKLYEYYFQCVLIGVKRYYEYRQLIQRKYKIILPDDFNYYSSYLYEMYNNLIDKNDVKCMNALEQLNLSADPNLIKMYDTIMASKKKQQVNHIQQNI